MAIEAARTVNLTAILSPDAFWTKHILDSLAGMEDAELAPGQSVLDMGSGAGLPGIPLALAVPGVRWVLLDASLRKVRFLERAVAALALEAEVVHGRAEDLGRPGERREAFDRVVARAVAPLPLLLELALPLVRTGGLLVAWKGPAVWGELEAATGALDALRGEVAGVREFSLGGEGRCIVRVRKVGATPERFPRRAGVAKRRPL